jgi:archaellum component FlaC
LSDRLIKDWELATKSDVNDLEKKYGKVSRDIDDLEKRFNEYRGYANKKFETIEERLKKVEEDLEKTE